MSFDKKIYTCKVCGRTDFGENGFIHKCPTSSDKIVQEEKEKKQVDMSNNVIKKQDTTSN